ncbi:unnamed protein product, partial [Lymnaea stagnalis]
SGDYKKTLVKIIDKVGEEKPPAKKAEPVKEKPRSQSPAKGVLIMERSKDTKATTVKAAVVTAKPKETQVKNEKIQQNEEKKDEKKGKDKKDEKEQKKEEKKEEKKDDDKINENDEDAVKLYKAMKGLGTKEDVIIEVIVRNSNSQRQTLKK